MNQNIYLSVYLVSTSYTLETGTLTVFLFSIIFNVNLCCVCFHNTDGQPSQLINVINTEVEIFNTYKSRPGSCSRWGFGNYKTFDGKIYSFQSDCTYTLISDIKTNSFHVQTRFDHGKISYVNVYIVDNLYQIRRNGKMMNSM